jgi:hypothetical protein
MLACLLAAVVLVVTAARAVTEAAGAFAPLLVQEAVVAVVQTRSPLPIIRGVVLAVAASGYWVKEVMALLVHLMAPQTLSVVAVLAVLRGHIPQPRRAAAAALMAVALAALGQRMTVAGTITLRLVALAVLALFASSGPARHVNSRQPALGINNA